MTPEVGPPLPRLAVRGLTVGTAVLAAALLLTCTRYGYHRDELYFLACGRRPAWGYPDQPPLTPLLARLTELIGPHDLLALRLPAVLIAAWITWSAALVAREFGGAGFAQGLAALTAGTGTFTLTSGNLLATSTVDTGIWTAAVWLVVRVLRTGRQRWWLAVGAVFGLGLLNKQLPAFLALALLAGVLLTPAARPTLRSRWLLAGAALAAACWAPVLAWQATHGWPQLTLAGQIRTEYGTPGQRLWFAVGQLVLFSIGAAVLWVSGLVRLLRRPPWPAARAIGVAWLVLILLLAITAGQVYYAAGLYPALIAAGAVGAERWRPRWRWTAVGATALTAAMLVPAALPVLPAATLDSSVWSGLAEPLRESVGWPGLVDQVRDGYLSLPVDRRRTAIVFTANYGEAGAIEEFGPSRGLPAPAFSGHNGFGLWGPPPQGAGPVLLVWRRGDPSAEFTGCTARGRVRTGVSNEEGNSAAVYLCDGPVGGWTAAWPRLRHLSA
jgi:hypothetical protein